jgi:hypothetical protein
MFKFEKKNDEKRAITPRRVKFKQQTCAACQDQASLQF